MRKVSARGDVDDPRAVCAASKLKAGEDLHRRNPLELARERFEETHGYPPEEITEFTEEEHYHSVMPAWGELVSLVIVPEGERRGVELLNFDGAKLMFSEDRELPQLEIWGGDQSIPLETLRERFGKTVLHEKEDLGRCVDVLYSTLKTHLGKDGGDADYNHKFAEETAGKLRRLRITLSPLVTYDLINQRLHVWGGVYENTPEGIRD